MPADVQQEWRAADRAEFDRVMQGELPTGWREVLVSGVRRVRWLRAGAAILNVLNILK